MQLHKSLIPVVNLAPVAGYRLRQYIPLDQLEIIIPQANADIVIEWQMNYDGGIAWTRKVLLERRDGSWRNPEVAAIQIESEIGQSEWENSDPAAFLECHIVSATDPTFSSLYPPSFYSAFDRTDSKPFYSDGALKFANPYVINQVQVFKAWCETYPACEVDRRRGVSSTIVLINPYPLPSVVSLELGGINRVRKKRVAAQSAVKVIVDELLDDDCEYWCGPVVAWGRNRVILFFISHSADTPRRFVTVEHSEVYRAAATGQRLSDKVRSRMRRTLRSRTPASERQRIATRKIPKGDG